jgi:ubiquinone/menaquinone biosynthesis C-methylase UbiE
MTLWNIYAWSYDILTRFKPYNDLQHDVAKAVPKKTARVLNIGCGTGNLEYDLLTHNTNLEMTGLDFSVPMLQRARAKNPTVHFIQHDLTQPLPFSDASFDIVIACNVLYATPASVISEIQRVCHTGGTIIIADPNGPYDLRDLKTHLSGTYVQTFRPFLNPVFIVKFICFMLINLIIDNKERAGEYKYRSQEEWKVLFPYATFAKTYAGMDWILVSPTKPS